MELQMPRKSFYIFSAITSKAVQFYYKLQDGNSNLYYIRVTTNSHPENVFINAQIGN